MRHSHFSSIGLVVLVLSLSASSPANATRKLVRADKSANLSQNSSHGHTLGHTVRSRARRQIKVVVNPAPKGSQWTVKYNRLGKLMNKYSATEVAPRWTSKKITAGKNKGKVLLTITADPRRPGFTWAPSKLQRRAWNKWGRQIDLALIPEVTNSRSRSLIADPFGRSQLRYDDMIVVPAVITGKMPW
jgi:hypothetical protein